MYFASGRSAKIAVVIGLALVGTPVAAYATEPTATQPTSSTTAATTSAQAEAQQSNAQTETVIGSADEEQATAQEGAAPTAPTAVNNATITSDLTPCVASDASGSTTVDGTASASQAGTESTTTDPSPADDAATSSDTSQSEASPSVTTDVDVYGKGHQTASDGQVAGSAGAGEKIDSLTLHVASPDGTSYSDADVEYRAHVEGTGWDARWTSGGNAVGTAGSGKRIEALQIRLREGSDLAKDWQLWARAYVQNHGWLAWTSTGLVGSTGQGLRLEALELRLLRIGAPDPTDASYDDFASTNGESFIDGTQARVQAHVQDIGWQGWVTDGKTAGTTGRSKRIKVANAYADGDVEVRAHVQDIGWQGWVTSAGYAGTTGRGKRIEAVEVRLTGELAKLYDVWYRAHVQTIGWMAWTKDGASAGTTGASGRMEAIQVLLVRKGGSAPSADGQATEISFFSTPDVIYTAHSKDVGWQGARKDGATAGTTGQSRRLEAMTIKLTGGEDALSGGISYRAHVQGTGWQGWVSDGSIAGTTGQARRLEAFQVKLTGAIAKFFDVVYQAHVQNVGWQSWVSNGQVAGTVGRALAAEAFKVKLVLKGASSVVASGLDYCWLKSSPYWSGQVKVLLMNKHYSKGRYDASHGGQHVIRQIVIHHNEGNLTTEGCWHTWQTREASAHYQVESSGTVGQLVYDSDTAWQAGNWVKNLDSIGIEHADAPGSTAAHRYLTEAAINAGSKLVALLCLQYNLGIPEWGVNVIGHNEVTSTDCPASLGKGGSQHNEYISKARSWYEKIHAAMFGN